MTSVGKIITPLVEAAERSKGKSCLLCMHFRLVERGTIIVCDRKLTVYSVASLPEEMHMLERCRQRAESCNEYEVDE